VYVYAWSENAGDENCYICGKRHIPEKREDSGRNPGVNEVVKKNAKNRGYSIIGVWFIKIKPI
jgi:hypothetical protein